MLLNDVLDQNDQIFKNLRSKVYPENNLYLFAQHISESYLAFKDPMMLVFVLASPTSVRELPSIISFIEIFSTLKIKPIFTFLFVEWPDLKELKKQGLNKTQQDFNTIFEKIKILLNKHIKEPNIKIISYNQIVNYINNGKDTLLNDKNFQTDLACIEQFYERENS